MTHTITPENANRRLDKFLFAYFNNAPHSLIYKLLRKKRIKLNGARANGNEILQQGDELRFFISPETMESCRKPITIAPAKPLTDIIFEDENILVVNKPAGLPSQGGISSDHLLARVQYYLQLPHAAICNRLDVNTSGLVICGKNARALQIINAAFANREIDKEYIAVVHGTAGSLGDSVTLEGAYKKDPTTNTATVTSSGDGIQVITSYTILATAKNYSLLSVSPITGRSHQIRAHLASIGHPLVGDKKYGGKPTPYAPAQLLHCRRMSVIMPLPQLLSKASKSWEAPLPESFEKCVKEWFEIWD